MGSCWTFQNEAWTHAWQCSACPSLGLHSPRSHVQCWAGAGQAELSIQLEDPSAYTDSEAAKDLNIKAARIAKYLEEKNYEWDMATEELSKLG